MSFFDKVQGTFEQFFKLGGFTGPRLKNNAGVIEARNSGDSAFAKLRVADGVDSNDAVNKSQLSSVTAFGSEYQTQTSEAESSTTSTSYQTKLTWTTASLPAGTYHFKWYSEVAHNKKDKGTDVSVRHGATEIGQIIFVNKLDGTGFYDEFSGESSIVVGSPGTQTFDIRYKVYGDNTAYIRRVRFFIWRVA